ncbi:hypothetical protein [Streptomyces sp. NPDC030920]|uniref:hypothetical protein n=1 Tax=Streptomyces sp. NPDC030920 TaxID=3365308 RepID=UPI0038507A00
MSATLHLSHGRAEMAGYEPENSADRARLPDPERDHRDPARNGRIWMFKALVEQWQANQEQKRAMAAEKWEQEKRWREEDRQEQRQERAEKEKIRQEEEKEKEMLRQEEQQKKAEKWARTEETYSILYTAHLGVMKKAATASYVSLICHEDTWTFIARSAFGMWSPDWLTSVVQEQPGQGGPVSKEGSFTKDPNLTPGRITKQDNGMQTIEVSGDNLVTILDQLWDVAYGQSLYKVIPDFGSNRRACGPIYRRIEAWLDELESGTADKPGHILVLDERLDTTQPA